MTKITKEKMIVKKSFNNGRMEGQNVYVWVGIEPQMPYNKGKVIVSKQENAPIGYTFAMDPKHLARA